MDIFKMATEIANNMSSDDKDAIENMDMEKMIAHVTKNVFKVMNVAQDPEQEQEQQPIKTNNLSIPKTRDICFDLNVDLADFYNSTKKKLNIKRKRIIEVDGKQRIVEEKKRITVNIERGMKDEHQIRFEGEADQLPGYIAGDIVITLIENEHEIFQRDNDNLIIIKNVNLYQIYDYTFDITHLDDRVLRIVKNSNDSLHLNDSLRKIPGQGMPIHGSSGSFGDLFIRFNIVIPKQIEPLQLKKLKEIFDNNTEPLGQTYNLQCVLENVSDTDLEEFESESESESDQSESELSVSSVSSDEDSNKNRYKR
jgi:DnaJ-class molecular chaperone